MSNSHNDFANPSTAGRGTIRKAVLATRPSQEPDGVSSTLVPGDPLELKIIAGQDFILNIICVSKGFFGQKS